MHENSWVHRDLSVGNVLLDKDGVGRLIDLEYAKQQDNESENYMVSFFGIMFRTTTHFCQRGHLSLWL